MISPPDRDQLTTEGSVAALPERIDSRADCEIPLAANWSSSASGNFASRNPYACFQLFENPRETDQMSNSETESTASTDSESRELAENMSCITLHLVEPSKFAVPGLRATVIENLLSFMPFYDDNGDGLRTSVTGDLLKMRNWFTSKSPVPEQQYPQCG